MDNVRRLHDDSHNDDTTEIPETVHDEIPAVIHASSERVPVEDAADAPEGRVLTDEESAELDRRMNSRGALVVARAKVPVVATRRAVVAVREHEPTMKSAKFVLRNSFTVIQGAESWVKRSWDASTMGTYRRQIKAAEMAGDREALADWIDRAESAKADRHDRLKDLPVVALGLVKVLGAATIAIPLAVFVIAVLTKLTGNGSFTGVWSGFFSAVGFMIAAVAFMWSALAFVMPPLVVLAAYREGKRVAEPPNWLVTTGDNTWDSAIDESTIALALQALRIPNITQFLKAGMKLQFITPARQQGRGTFAVVRLPGGVPAVDITRKRVQLATGLHRAASEVWPTTGEEAGILELWVADKGALAGGAGPYPLLDEGFVDVFKGVPIGRTLRGDEIRMPINGVNTITGGAPGQGKSASARSILAGCALDPTVELRAWIPDENFDFERFKPRCSRYVRGDDPESMRQIRDDIKELHDEMAIRGKLLGEFETDLVTRKIADMNIGLHPLVGLLEEAHVAFNHPIYGKEITEYMEAIVRLGRKRGIHMIISTQAPTATSIPRDITRNCANGVAFYVADHHANDGLLGAGAFKEGIRATELIPNKDRGTSVTKGITNSRSEIIQWYFLGVAKGNDQVTPLIKRSLEAIKKRGLTAPDEAIRPEIETRDLLADLDEVLDTEPVRIADVPALLKRLAPTWTPYATLTGKDLRALLADDYGIKVPSTGNKFPLDPATVRDAIVLRERDRDEAGDDDSEADPLAS